MVGLESEDEHAKTVRAATQPANPNQYAVLIEASKPTSMVPVREIILGYRSLIPTSRCRCAQCARDEAVPCPLHLSIKPPRSQFDIHAEIRLRLGLLRAQRLRDLRPRPLRALCTSAKPIMINQVHALDAPLRACAQPPRSV
jgi:hypothetical protein